MPTYMIPSTVTDFADALSGVLGGQLDLPKLLAAVGDTVGMVKADVGEDGNLYLTYNSGNLPLLEPFQFLPRTISYLPG